MALGDQMNRGGEVIVRQAALLIDLDNFHDAEQIEAAYEQMKSRVGRVSACRAYGNAMRLQTLGPVWHKLGGRTFPNLALEKNTTDAALVADAVALYFQNGIQFFGIASGDADFAPLAIRLREWGCEVWCFSVGEVLFQGAESYYDKVVRFVDLAKLAVTVEAALAKSVPQPEPTPAPIPKSQTEASITPVVTPRNKPPPVPPQPKSALVPLSEQELSDVVAVKNILSAIPVWLPDTIKPLNQLGNFLKSVGFAKTSKPLHELFRKYPAYFKVLPSTGVAKHVRLLKKPK